MEKKKRGCLPGFIVTLMFAAATGYIVFVAVTQPDRLTLLFRQPDTAPAIAQAAEGGESPYAPANPFETFHFYIPDKQPEYEIYRTDNPSLTDEEVVWRVNAGLNRPFFSEPYLITDQNPLLVNPYNRLPDFFTPISLEAIDRHGRLATPETVRAFNCMQTGALAEGFNLYVQSAYRTVEYQRELYNQAGGDGAVARPGFSEHHTGRALDLGGPDGLLDSRGPTDTGRWVAAHAHEYGFIVRYAANNTDITGYMHEPWHITFVGEAISREMNADGYGSLEEYTAKNPGAALP
jgi:D-alanyl-D-alanine carboxypeptidase